MAGSLKVTTYDGVTDDLLSAGLNLEGLQGAAPGFADPLNPEYEFLLVVPPLKIRGGTGSALRSFALVP